jgi:uncharacterized protein (TIGR02145 family)
MTPPQPPSTLHKYPILHSALSILHHAFSIIHYPFSITTCVFLLLLTPHPTLAAKKVALVIGNSQYKADPLPNPVNDAADMAGVLKKLGFEVILEKDADKNAMVGALRTFHKKLGASDIGLFYYAGHGMQISGNNYLIPVRHAIAEEFEVESEAIGANRILSAMESAGNPLNIVILDACRNNPFQSFRGAQKGLAEMKAPRGTIISYATSPGSLAEDGRGRNGTYTEALLKNFQVPGLDVQKMFNRTGLDVMEKTDGRQMPWVSTTPLPDFYLAGGAPEDRYLPPEQPQTAQPQQAEQQPVPPAQAPAQAAVQPPAPEPPPEAPQKARLYVVTDPGGGRVRIMNIVEKYHDGIELDLARYKLEGSLEGFRTKTQWITIDRPGDVDITLTLTPEPAAPAVAAPTKTAPAQTVPRKEPKPVPAPATSRPVATKPATKSCGAYTAPGVWKEFDCYNLAAIGKTTNDDPFTPSWRLIGGYWQWGRKGPDPSRWYNTNTKHFAHGPTGSGLGSGNWREISGWAGIPTSEGAWSNSRKTANDPCPSGYRVPTKKQWDGVLKNNKQRTVGSWSDRSTNYSSARFFGDKLMLPAAGYRYYSSGALDDRGNNGSYWSSSEYGSYDAWGLYFSSGLATTNLSDRLYGQSVRCVAE